MGIIRTILLTGQMPSCHPVNSTRALHFNVIVIFYMFITNVADTLLACVTFLMMIFLLLHLVYVQVCFICFIVYFNNIQNVTSLFVLLLAF